MADDIPPDVQALVRERRRIDAIKALREHTGLGLKEARDQIVALERQMGIVPAQGNALLFWIVLIVVGLLVYWASTKFQA